MKWVYYKWMRIQEKEEVDFSHNSIIILSQLQKEFLSKSVKRSKNLVSKKLYISCLELCFVFIEVPRKWAASGGCKLLWVGIKLASGKKISSGKQDRSC